jgi:hypothetical protein
MQFSTVFKIAEELEPGLLPQLSRVGTNPSQFSHAAQLQAAYVLLGVLRDAEEVKRNLEPEGPKLFATDLHPWVWEAAAELWSDGHRREAVQRAATRIFDEKLPKKLQEPSGDPNTLLDRFNPSKDGQPPRPRLRFTGQSREDNPKTWDNLHTGAALFGKGCVQAIRNRRTHGLEVEEQEALEELAALSLLARWIENADVVTEQPLPPLS